MKTDASLRIAAELTHLALIRRFIRETALALRADPTALHDVVQAADEAATNIIVHGYRGQPGIVEVEVGHAGDALVLRLRDQAPPFDPTRHPAPNFLTLPPEQRPVGGLGIYLMREFMDEVAHRVTAQGGNELTLVKRAILANSDKEVINEHND